MSTKREYNEWIQMRWMDEETQTDQPRILLIGDSIVCGHGEKLHYAVCDHYTVDYFASSKIVSDVDFRSDLEFMIRKKKYDMIIFNNGLHGGRVSDEEYGAALADLAQWLKPFAPILIWRNSTPCYTLDPANPHPFEERVGIRNAIAEKIMKDAGIPVLDAYSLMKGKPELSTDGWHFTAEGYQILINAEKDLIERELGGKN